jgi:hypothetical protein
MAPPVVDRNTVDADGLRWPPYATAVPRPPAPVPILTPHELSEKTCADIPLRVLARIIDLDRMLGGGDDVGEQHGG